MPPFFFLYRNSVIYVQNCTWTCIQVNISKTLNNAFLFIDKLLYLFTESIEWLSVFSFTLFIYLFLLVVHVIDIWCQILYLALEFRRSVLGDVYKIQNIVLHFNNVFFLLFRNNVVVNNQKNRKQMEVTICTNAEKKNQFCWNSQVRYWPWNVSVSMCGAFCWFMC